MRSSPIKVLVVEDNPHLSILAKKTLEGSGCDVLTVPDGFEGMKTLRSNRDIDVVLLDIMMPRMGGMEFLARLEDVKGDRDFKVCMMTAKGADENIRECLRSGADDYLIKPMDRNILIEKVRTLAGKSALGHFAKVETFFSGIIKRLNSDIDVQVTSLSETEITFDSPIRLPIGAKVMMEAPELDRIFRKKSKVYLRLTKCLYDGHSFYKTKATFLALDEESYKYLRAITIKGVGLYE